MKGILLAGGSGTRLYPLTKLTSKQLLPVYDKPMIYYPLSTLMLFGIKDILIISTPQDIPNIQRLFEDGSQLGLTISYTIQQEPNGIAQAFILGEDFIGTEDVCLILGDNIFYIPEELHIRQRNLIETKNNYATIFSYHVSDPERFGVVEFNDTLQVISIEEKPKKPKSNFVSVGLYFYPSDVVEKAYSLRPSKRGELEITDLNNLYLKAERLCVIPMERGSAWLDAGTPESLMEASSFIQIIEKRQGLKITCIEEIAYKKGYIDRTALQQCIQNMKISDYRAYLETVLERS